MASDFETTAAWLTASLVRSGALEKGAVESFELEVFRSTHGDNARIHLVYEPGSTGPRPRSLFLKVCSSDHFDRSEVDFYARDYADFGGPPVVRCHAAEYRASPRGYRLLLEDLSATHRDQRAVTPTAPYALAFAEAAARLHGRYWGVERLEPGGHAAPDRAALDRFVEVGSAGLAALLRELPPRDAETLAAAWGELPGRLARRARRPRHLTLVHGDLNPTNVLAGRDPKRSLPLYFVDRQPFDWSLRVWTGASDLAYAIGLYWDASVRAGLEASTLKAYHEALLAQGIEGFTLSDLVADHALGLSQAISVPAHWCLLEEPREQMRWLWTRQAGRLAAALRAVDTLV